MISTSSRAEAGKTGPDLSLRPQHARPGLIPSAWIDTCFHRGLCSFERVIFASSITSTTAVTASAMLPRSLAYFVRRGRVAQKKAASPPFIKAAELIAPRYEGTYSSTPPPLLSDDVTLFAELMQLIPAEELGNRYAVFDLLPTRRLDLS